MKLSDTQLRLDAQLHPWFSCFYTGTAEWGLVSDVRPDGSVYQRHGVIIELTADITAAVVNEQDSGAAAYDNSDDKEDDSDHQEFAWRLREVVDLVKLALVVLPVVVKPLLRKEKKKKPWDDREQDPHVYEEEIRALARGQAPVELRVRLEFHSTKTERLTQWLEDFLAQELQEASESYLDETPNELRYELVDLASKKTAAYRRITSLPVPIVLAIDSTDRLHKAEMVRKSQDLFTHLISTATTLQACQQHHQHWEPDTLYTALVAKEIELTLRHLFVTQELVESAKVLVGLGVPVTCVHLNLDFRMVTCTQADLHEFVQVVTHTGSAPICVETGTLYHDDHNWDTRVRVDLQRLRSIVHAISAIDRELKLDLTSIFTLCWSPINRQAIVRGLFEEIFSRSRPSTSVSFESVEFRDGLAPCIEQCAAVWRLANHPHKTLRLKSVYMGSYESAIAPIRAFLAACDDVEHVRLRRCEEDRLGVRDLAVMLRFPSLRSLRLEDVAIPTMDLFDPSLNDPRLPHKPPPLERLELEGLELEDPSSIGRFISRLDPTAPAPSVLSSSLRELAIVQEDGSPTEDEFGFGRSGVRLAINDPDAANLLRNVLASNRVLQYVDFVGDFENIPVRLARLPRAYQRSRDRRLIPAPLRVRHSAASRARNVAFLSATRSGDSARCRVDASVVRLVFAFSAPHVYRDIEIE